jgi:hypothetical protein
MNGAIPPEIMDDKIAGMTRKTNWRLEIREKRRRIEGWRAGESRAE